MSRNLEYLYGRVNMQLSAVEASVRVLVDVKQRIAGADDEKKEELVESADNMSNILKSLVTPNIFEGDKTVDSNDD